MQNKKSPLLQEVPPGDAREDHMNPDEHKFVDVKIECKQNDDPHCAGCALANSLCACTKKKT